MGWDDWRDSGGRLGVQLSGIYGEGRLEGDWRDTGSSAVGYMGRGVKEEEEKEGRSGF